VWPGANGLLAYTTAEWVQALEALHTHVELWQRMGEAGRKRVEEKYCLQVTGPRLVALLQSVATKAGQMEQRY